MSDPHGPAGPRENRPAEAQKHEALEPNRQSVPSQAMRAGNPFDLRGRSPWQVLGGYVLASWLILQVAETLGSLIGLPLWFGRSLLVLLLALLPIVLVTSHVQSRRAGATAVPGEAGQRRVRDLFSWKNTALAAGLSFAALGIGTAAHLGLRSLGVGPGAPLIARGVLEEEELLLLADFHNRTADSLLGGAVTEALRVDLSQSPAIALMPALQLREVLLRMRRDPGEPLDAGLAQEVARREGLKAFIVGEIRTVGSAYVLFVRLLATDSGEELAAYRETARDRGEIIAAVDNLSKRLRARIGESLAAVRQSPPLPSVTTGSIEALELLAAALGHSRQGDYEAALPLMERAAAEDTTFAMAYRALAVMNYNRGDPVEGHRYAELAYRHAERLPDRERYLASAGFHNSRGRIDSTAYYYRLLLERWPRSHTYLNNLGDVFERMGRYEEALDLYRRSISVGSEHAAGYVNLASAARTLGLHALADSALREMSERFPPGRLHAVTAASNAFYAGDLARQDSIANEWAATADVEARGAGRELLAAQAGMRGRLGRALALADSAAEGYREVGSPIWIASAIKLLVNTTSVTEPEAAEPYLDRWLPAFQEAAVVRSSPRFYHGALGLFATGYAAMGALDKTSALLAAMDSLAASADFRPDGIQEHVKAVLAVREDRPDDALAHLESARIANYGLVHDFSRLLLADAYAALGRVAEAAAQYDTVAGTRGVNFLDVRAHPPLQSVAHERAGRAYLAVGDTAAALRHLGAFAELWESADPEFQPRVQAARETISAILAVRG